MAEYQSFDLDERSRAFLQAAVASGRYRCAGDGIRAALLLLENHDRRRALHDALVAGERSGESAPFDFDGFIADKHASLTGSGMPTQQAKDGRSLREPLTAGTSMPGRGGYPAGPKPAKGLPPVPRGLRKPRNQ